VPQATALSQHWDFTGFLLDIYNVDSQIYIWLIDDEKRLFLAVDEYFPVIYAHGNANALYKLSEHMQKIGAVAGIPRFEKKILFYPNRIVDALRLEIAHPTLLPGIRRKLFTLYNKFDIYHSDLDPVTSYMSDRDIYPLAPIKIRTQIHEGNNRIIRIEATQHSKSFEYHFPDLRILQMSLKHSHRLGVGAHNPLLMQIAGREYTIAEQDHKNYIHKINQIMRDENPDCILSSFGDQVIFPFLFSAAQESGLTIELDRDLNSAITRSIRRKGSSFNTYGSWIFRAASYPLYGRWHIDQQNSFTFKHTDLAGTIELARISRMHVQRVARASTGNALTEMEADVAIRKGYLVPWQKSALENRKTWYELQLFDKGGLVYQPNIDRGSREDAIHGSASPKASMPPGTVRHNVAQLDFSQMYPSIMNLHNISPETVNCPCCADETEIPRVPEIGYHICLKRRGVVADALEHILERRHYYKGKLQTADLTPEQRKTYVQRIDSLKWMNVVSFGYLGFRNAKFGKLESHESVTAFGRDKLLTAVRLAEERGFELVHAITDCIFIQKSDETPFAAGELEELCAEILRATRVEMSCEGIYSWALFLPSRSDEKLPVANRYLGRFTTGELKMRGVVVRRKDTPEYIARFQRDIIALLRSCADARAVAGLYETAHEIYQHRLHAVETGNVPWDQLLLRRTVSHELEEYSVMNGTSLTMRELSELGLAVSPGEKVRYLVVEQKYYSRSGRYLSEERAAMTGKDYLPFDKKFYSRQLYEAFAEIFDPFIADKIESPEQAKQPVFF
jgi:DNA polymerase elongation subunit (family B)